MPIEDAPELADAAHRAAEGGKVVYLTEHGQRLAAIVPAAEYETYKHLQEEAEIARAVAASLADPRPPQVFTSVEDMMREADQS